MPIPKFYQQNDKISQSYVIKFKYFYTFARPFFKGFNYSRQVILLELMSLQ